MHIILFEDSGAKNLAPVSLTRPAWAIRCGSFRLVDWIENLSQNISIFVRSHLQTIQIHDWPNFSLEAKESAEPVLMVNARLAPTVTNIEKLQSFYSRHAQSASSLPVIVRSGWAMAVAVVPGSMAGSLSQDCEEDRVAEIERLGGSFTQLTDEYEFDLFDYPHDIIANHMQGCRASIEYRIKHGDYSEVQDNVFVANSKDQTVIPTSTVFDTGDGPVVFESNVRIGPFCFFRGPVHVGADSKISEHSSIKDAVAIAHTCKMGGEVEGVQTEPWSNKQHYGFLGHSYIGSWINLGAGTCNSDLKNTYGTVNVIYDGQKVSTGMQFVGCIMGDYSRTAINTSIYTGKIIGVGSTLYGMTPHNVPSFVNCAQSLRQIGLLPPEVLVSIQKRMFGRRNVTQRPCDIQLIHDVFAMTSYQRDESWSSDPIAF
jgi:glucose-1-phosphate thymidylyltransferase